MITRTRMMIAVVLLGCSIGSVGCGDSRGPTGPSEGGEAEEGGDSTESPADSIESDGSDTSTPDTQTPDTATPPPRNPACGDFDDGVYGQKLPWTGFEHAGNTYTCNRCRGGDPLAQGVWRFMDFDTEDPTLPLSGGYRERLTIDGNTFTHRAAGVDLGKQTEVNAQGWYFCGTTPEIEPEARVYIYTDVNPEGGFGLNSGLVFTGLFLYQGADKLAWQYDAGFGTGPSTYALFCRVGTIIETINGEERPCEDPFEQ